MESLEPTLIREGRFDARLRLDMPDEEDRKEILPAQLRRNGWRQHDLTLIVLELLPKPTRLRPILVGLSFGKFTLSWANLTMSL